jgi:RND superfamily putative drug exporter
MLEKLGNFVTRYRYAIILVWIVAAVLISVLGPKLADVESNDQSSFLPGSYESVQAGNIAKQINPQANAASDIIVFQNKAKTALSDQDKAAIYIAVHQLASSHPGKVTSVTTSLRQISPSGKVQLATVVYSGDAQNKTTLDSVMPLRAQLSSDIAGTNITAGVTGQVAVGYDTQGSFNKALKIVSIGTILLVLILPALVFRSPLIGLLPVISVSIVYSMASSLIAMAANAFNFKVSQQLSVLFTVVLFGVGTDYILFTLFRYRERLRGGDHTRAAVSFALSRSSEAILSAGLVVIASFAGLLFAKFGIFTSFAPGLIICVAVMLLAAVTFVPALIAVLGTRLFWPSKAWQSHSLKPTISRRLGGSVSRRPALTTLCVLIVLLALASGALAYKADFSSFSQPPAHTASASASQTIANAFPAGIASPTDIYVVSGRSLSTAELRPLTAKLMQAQGVATVLPPIITPDGTHAIYSLILKEDPYSSQAFHDIGGSIHDAAHGSAPAGTKVYIGGVTAALADVQKVTTRDLKVIFPIAGVFIFIILLLLLRSIVAPLYLLLSVSLGFASTLGATVFIFTDIGSAPGLIFFLPIMLYVFVVAIGTDYNILTITRLREEIKGGNSPRKAAALTIEHSSATVVSAGLILAGTFASLLLAKISLLSQMGSAIAIGVSLSAFVIAPIFVPSVSALLGKIVWWPGHRGSISKD